MNRRDLRFEISVSQLNMTEILKVIVLAFLCALLSIVFCMAIHKSEEYLKLLPGYNCGACGFGSCGGMAKKMCEDINNYKRCKPLKGEKLKEMQEYVNNAKNA